MQKTTVYLPDELKRALGRAAAARGVSEAELIREALRLITADVRPPRPRLPLFESGQPDLAARADEYLEGFGDITPPKAQLTTRRRRPGPRAGAGRAPSRPSGAWSG